MKSSRGVITLYGAVSTVPSLKLLHAPVTLYNMVSLLTLVNALTSISEQ